MDALAGWRAGGPASTPAPEAPQPYTTREKDQLESPPGAVGPIRAFTGDVSQLALVPRRLKAGCPEGQDSPTSGCAPDRLIKSWWPPPRSRDGGRWRALHEVPPVLRFNPHVRSGYRAASSYAACLCSVVELHNETGNIATHLAPALALAAALATGALQPWPGAELAFWGNVLSTLLCFTASVAYHTCLAVHQRYHLFLKLDVFAVLAVLAIGGHTQLWWGLACAPWLRAAFLAVYHAAGLVCVHAALTATSALHRAAPMAVLLLIRLAGLAARLAIGQGGGGMAEFLWMEGLSLAGGAINAGRWPERWLQPADAAAPAPLDLVANSHQIMHVLVAAALVRLHRGLAADHGAAAALVCQPPP